MKFLFLFVILAVSSLFAQTEQPQKESSSDLRNRNVLFSIEEVKSGKQFWLERTATLDNYIKSSEGEKLSIQKIDSKTAKKLDQDFSSSFLRCQYEIESVPGTCEVTLRLSMKGETQDICKKDDKKSREIQVFLDEFSKRF